MVQYRINLFEGLYILRMRTPGEHVCVRMCEDLCVKVPER